MRMCIQYTTLYSSISMRTHNCYAYYAYESVLVIIVGASQSRNKVEQYQDKEPLVLTHHHATSFLRIITTLVLLSTSSRSMCILSMHIIIIIWIHKGHGTGSQLPRGAPPNPVWPWSARPYYYYSRVVCILREYSKYDRSTLTVMPEYIVPCLYSYSLVLQLVVTTLRARISNILHTLIECILCVL